MGTAIYTGLGGSKLVIEYDENAPCVICGEPVVAASTGGTIICPWCDMGHCRYCGVDLPMGRTKEDSIRKIKEHMAWHKENQPSPKPRKEGGI